ncbi:MAG: transcriptional regulator, Crp/Fnr family [Caulobacter sp.]|jgi:CRP-like cAMP-binding protein|nr:transcriptional regulator, Crp/Fnr family [Caulobacter sp.]
MTLTMDCAVLRGGELFANLTDAELVIVAAAGTVRSLGRGRMAFRQGDAGESCHSLLQGRVKVIKTRPDGAQSVLRFIGPGEMYGTVAALMGQPFPADAVAVVDSVEIVWSVKVMRQLMQRFPAIAMGSVAAAGERLFELQIRVGELTADRVERRIARALSRLARQAGRRTDDGVEIDFPITRQDLAEMAGTTLHTVSRTLSAWDQAGITESARRHIVIRKPHALVAMAEDLADD